MDLFIKGSCDSPYFLMQVTRKNTLGTIVKHFCCEAGFSGKYTNHSGEVTCAMTLFKENIDEQLTKRQTGHRPDAVCVATIFGSQVDSSTKDHVKHSL